MNIQIHILLFIIINKLKQLTHKAQKRRLNKYKYLCYNYSRNNERITLNGGCKVQMDNGGLRSKKVKNHWFKPANYQ